MSNERICERPTCNREVTGRKDARYCSDYCRVTAFRERNAPPPPPVLMRHEWRQMDITLSAAISEMSLLIHQEKFEKWARNNPDARDALQGKLAWMSKMLEAWPEKNSK